MVPQFTSAEVERVRASYAKIAARSEEAAAVFYKRLFTLNPALKSLFHGDMREQGRKLIATLGLIAQAVDQVEALTPSIRQLGVRHASYRVKEAHYATVATALLATIEEIAGPEYSPEIGAAWAKVYGFISNQMIDAARAHSIPTAGAA